MSKSEHQQEEKASSQGVKKHYHMIKAGIAALTPRQKKIISIAWIILLLLVIMHAAVQYRMGPYHLEVTDLWAEDMIMSNIRNSAIQELRTQHPTLPDQQIRTMADNQIRELLSNPDNRQQIEAQVAETGAYFRSRLQDDRGHTYLLSIDPFYFYRLSKNYIENGHPGEYLNDEGVPVSNFVLAPSERPVAMEFIVWFHGTLFKVGEPIFGWDIEDLPAIMYFTPIIFMVLAGIVAFFIGRKIQGNLTGFLFGLLLVIHPVVLNRTMGGYVHKDSFNFFFPLLIAYLVLLAWTSRSWKQNALFSVLAGLTFMVYQWAWAGYIFAFYIIGSTIGLTLLAQLVFHIISSRSKDPKHYLKQMQPQLIAGIGFFASTLFAIAVTRGVSSILATVFGSVNMFSGLIDTVRTNIWPNIYTTVAELNPATFTQVVDMIGGSTGKFLFFLSALGFVLYAIWHWRANKGSIDRYNLFVLFLGLMWFGGMIFASTRGVRFVMLVVPIFCLGLALFVSMITNLLTDAARKSKDFNPSVVATTSLVVLFVVIIQIPFVPFSGALTSDIWNRADSASIAHTPMMTDEWHDLLKNIEANSQEDAIISSWWDFGHQFIAVANRGATADGGSQNTPVTYWLGRMLVEEDDVLSAGVLRMLHCDSNIAFTKLDGYVGQDMLTSIQLLEQLLGVSRDQAYSILIAAGLTEDEANDVLSSTHCTPPEAFVIVSEDMVGKATVWGHFGLWNFERAHQWQIARRSTLQSAVTEFENMGLSSSEARTLYSRLQSMNQRQGNAFISPHPNFVTPRAASCSASDLGGLVCPTGIIVGRNGNTEVVLEGISIRNGTAQILIGNYVGTSRISGSEQSPVLFGTITDADFEVERYDGGQYFGVIFDEVSSSVVIGSPELIVSTFTRLYFFEGRGTAFFTPFDEVTTVFGHKVAAFTVDWDSYLQELN